MVVFLEPSHLTDKPIVSLLTEVIQTGLRKLYSIIDYDSLLNEVC